MKELELELELPLALAAGDGDVEAGNLELDSAQHPLLDPVADGDSSTDAAQCRICLECGGRECQCLQNLHGLRGHCSGQDLIAPCQCKGTQKFVHRSCLDNWRAVKEGFAFSHCTECRAVFQMRVNVPANSRWLRLKFQLLVFRDHAAIFVLVQTVVVTIGLLVYVVYGEGLKEMFGYEEHPYSFYGLGAAVLTLIGLMYGFFIAIICRQRISNRHYHVLSKQERTKEYIVEGVNEES